MAFFIYNPQFGYLLYFLAGLIVGFFTVYLYSLNWSGKTRLIPIESFRLSPNALPIFETLNKFLVSTKGKVPYLSISEEEAFDLSTSFREGNPGDSEEVAEGEFYEALSNGEFSYKGYRLTIE